MYAADVWVRPVNGLDTNDGLTFATAYKTKQKGIDNTLAGQILGLVAEADEAIAVKVDDDTNVGSGAGLIEIIALNAVGDRDGTKYWLDGESVSVSGIGFGNVYSKRYEGVCIKNTTGSAIVQAASISFYIAFDLCETLNTGSDGVDFYVSAGIYGRYHIFNKCKFVTPTTYGIRAGSGAVLNFCHFKNSASFGVVGYRTSLEPTFVLNCIASGCASTGFYYGNVPGMTFIQCTSDDNLNGFGSNSTGSAHLSACRITNNTYGIRLENAGGLIIGWNCYFYNNGTKTATNGGLISLHDDEDMAGDGYKDQASGDYTLTENAEGRRFEWPLDTTHSAYPTAGLSGQDYMRPRITGISNPGLVLAGGQRTVKGGGFSGTTPIVKLDSAGGPACTVDSVVDDNEMLVTFPAQGAGQHKLYCETDAGTFLSADNLITYLSVAVPGVPSGQILKTFNKSFLIQASFAVNLTGIKVFRDTDPGGAFPEITASPFVSYEFIEDNNGAGLAEDTPYYYKLKGTNTGGDSAFSAIFAGRTTIGKEHPRTAIRDKVVAKLTGAVYYDSAALGVHKNRFLPWFPEELPALGVYILDEPVDEEGTAPREYKRKPTLKIEICLKEDDVKGVDDKVDKISKQVEDILFLDNTLGDLVDDLLLENTRLAPKINGDHIYAGGIMDWEIIYRTDAPEEQGAPLVVDLEKSVTQIGVGGDATPVDEHAIEAEIDHN